MIVTASNHRSSALLSRLEKLLERKNLQELKTFESLKNRRRVSGAS